MEFLCALPLLPLHHSAMLSAPEVHRETMSEDPQKNRGQNRCNHWVGPRGKVWVHVLK